MAVIRRELDFEPLPSDLNRTQTFPRAPRIYQGTYWDPSDQNNYQHFEQKGLYEEIEISKQVSENTEVRIFHVQTYRRWTFTLWRRLDLPTTSSNLPRPIFITGTRQEKWKPTVYHIHNIPILL